jgi:hypothetical protein
VGATGSPFSMLQKAGAQVTTLGPSTVNGVAVHGYQVAVTPTVLATLLTDYGLPAAEAQQLGSSGLSTVDLTVDVGDTGLVQQVHASTMVASGGQTTTLSVSAQFSGYGQPVTITPPAATQTATFFAVAGSLAQSPASQLLSSY